MQQAYNFNRSTCSCRRSISVSDNRQEEKQGTDGRKRSRDDDCKRNDKRKGYSQQLLTHE